MLKVISARLKQGYRTIKFPAGSPPAMPDRFRGRPLFAKSQCGGGCRACADACPTGAISIGNSRIVDLGKCLFCLDCAQACPEQAISFSDDYRLSVSAREHLVLDEAQSEIELARQLDRRMKRLFGRSLKLRQVSAGGCAACEADVNVLGTIGWDLGRFGIQMVASPRHADGILLTGPVTRNMEIAVRKTWDAIAEPKIMIAVGACAISGGPYLGHPETDDGIGAFAPDLKIDLFIPGCPPHPLTILDGLLRLVGRIEGEGRKPKRR